ncbi:MAG: hypothetical protein AAFV28_14740, partial [Cyanobacteria bacterium J06635_13]
MSKLESSYLKLIDSLLSNPKEQETNILNAHSELVNQEFISRLMSVGKRLTRAGDIASAERLIDLAQKLLQLEKTQTSNSQRKEYFDFLMSLLQQVSNRIPPAEIYEAIRQHQKISQNQARDLAISQLQEVRLLPPEVKHFEQVRAELQIDDTAF